MSRLLIMGLVFAGTASALTLRQNCADRVVRCFAPAGSATEYRFNADATSAQETFVERDGKGRQSMGKLLVIWAGGEPYTRDGIRLFYAEGGVTQVTDGEPCEFVDR